MSKERDMTMTVHGEPTTAERAAITAAVWSITAGNARTNRDSADLPDAQGPAPGLQSSDEAAANGATRRLEYRRRCPRCNEKYDSTYCLNDCRQITTSEEGSSTICVGPSRNRIYVHSPR